MSFKQRREWLLLRFFLISTQIVASHLSPHTIFAIYIQALLSSTRRRFSQHCLLYLIIIIISILWDGRNGNKYVGKLSPFHFHLLRCMYYNWTRDGWICTATDIFITWGLITSRTIDGLAINGPHIWERDSERWNMKCLLLSRGTSKEIRHCDSIELYTERSFWERKIQLELRISNWISTVSVWISYSRTYFTWSESNQLLPQQQQITIFLDKSILQNPANPSISALISISDERLQAGLLEFDGFGQQVQFVERWGEE